LKPVSRYFLKLSFKGTAYHGWQVQENAVSVQEIIQNSLERLLGLPDIQVVGCGRTDTGVHAKEFYAHFDIDKGPDEISRLNLLFNLNRILPMDIAIQRIIPVRKDAHSRFNATSRTYQYHISRMKEPFAFGTSYYYYGDLDVERMNEGSKIVMEYTDFTSFSKLHTQVKTNNCKVSRAEWEEDGKLLVFTISADRFLRNMVRAIVGTLLDLGRGKIRTEDLRKIIESKDRAAAGPSVPPEGLFLSRVEYPEELFLQ
jgi:tRNA pseudouridine38-40 synthase